MATRSVSSNILAAVVLLGIGALLLSWSAFTVSEINYAIKFRFGQIVRADYKPGLYFKIPMVDNVRKFDRRVLTRNYPAEQFLTSEGKILRIDFYMKWQIEDVNRYYQATNGDAENAALRLGEIVKDGLKGVIARRTLQQVVSAERSEFIDELLKNTGTNSTQLGVKLIDVRVKRIDLPDEVGESVFNRMRQDFARQAAQLRAEGVENSERLKAEADRQRTEILADGYRQAEIIRGEGDAKAAETYARAYSRNAEFYAFFRSMQAYRESLGQDNDVLVISPDGEFFKYLNRPSAR
jgi:modulator of FtsH protease HflC